MTYHHIEMWLDASNSRPVKARFYTESGQLLKTAYYRRYQPQLGVERPTETVIIDGLDTNWVTVMRFADYAWREVPEVWRRWLALDPVRMVPLHAESLRSLRAIYIDAGRRDEWFLDLGAEAFRLELETIGVTGVRFELFDATHMGVDYRYPLSLAWLCQRINE